MTFVEQKDGRRNCGQVAVAALTDTPLETVTALIGHSHGTTTRELAAALRALGYSCPDRAQAKWLDGWYSAFGLAQVREPGRSGWHWVAVGKCRVYDGLRSGPMELADYISYERKVYGGRLTSFLPVTKNGEGK